MVGRAPPTFTPSQAPQLPDPTPTSPKPPENITSLYKLDRGVTVENDGNRH
ncbi:hypothetical protein GCM10023178_46910 [Actinomadura luteofluorescens]